MANVYTVLVFVMSSMDGEDRCVKYLDVQGQERIAAGMERVTALTERAYVTQVSESVSCLFLVFANAYYL